MACTPTRSAGSPSGRRLRSPYFSAVTGAEHQAQTRHVETLGVQIPSPTVFRYLSVLLFLSEEYGHLFQQICKGI